MFRMRFYRQEISCITIFLAIVREPPLLDRPFHHELTNITFLRGPFCQTRPYSHDASGGPRCHGFNSSDYVQAVSFTDMVVLFDSLLCFAVLASTSTVLYPCLKFCACLFDDGWWIVYDVASTRTCTVKPLSDIIRHVLFCKTMPAEM